MDTLSIIVTLISVIASILQIILFFKMWRMCNDVSALRHQQCQEDSSNEIDNGYGKFLISFVVSIVFFLILIILAASN